MISRRRSFLELCLLFFGLSRINVHSTDVFRGIRPEPAYSSVGHIRKEVEQTEKKIASGLQREKDQPKPKKTWLSYSQKIVCVGVLFLAVWYVVRRNLKPNISNIHSDAPVVDFFVIPEETQVGISPRQPNFMGQEGIRPGMKMPLMTQSEAWDGLRESWSEYAKKHSDIKECCICFDEYIDTGVKANDRGMTACGHFLCKGCFEKLLLSSCKLDYLCPMCRAVFCRINRSDRELFRERNRMSEETERMLRSIDLEARILSSIFPESYEYFYERALEASYGEFAELVFSSR